MPGSITSSTITSYGVAWAIQSASSPFTATSASSPSSRRPLRIRPASFTSSSTTSTRTPSAAWQALIGASPRAPTFGAWLGPRIAVLVADDHPVYREGIVRAVKERPDLQLVAEVATGREALDAIAELRPQVAVLDMKMPDLDGRHVLGAIGRDGLPTRVLFVSAYVDSEIVYAAIGGGARGYLSKDATRQQICDAVAAVARGDTVFAAAGPDRARPRDPAALGRRRRRAHAARARDPRADRAGLPRARTSGAGSTSARRP